VKELKIAIANHHQIGNQKFMESQNMVKHWMSLSQGSAQFLILPDSFSLDSGMTRLTKSFM
jgi:hypothetical protein